MSKIFKILLVSALLSSSTMTQAQGWSQSSSTSRQVESSMRQEGPETVEITTETTMLNGIKTVITKEKRTNGNTSVTKITEETIDSEGNSRVDQSKGSCQRHGHKKHAKRSKKCQRYGRYCPCCAQRESDTATESSDASKDPSSLDKAAVPASVPMPMPASVPAAAVESKSPLAESQSLGKAIAMKVAQEIASLGSTQQSINRAMADKMERVNQAMDRRVTDMAAIQGPIQGMMAGMWPF